MAASSTASGKPKLPALKTPTSAAFPSELSGLFSARSATAPASALSVPLSARSVKAEDAWSAKTPVSPPTAYTDFLRFVSVAASPLSPAVALPRDAAWAPPSAAARAPARPRAPPAAVARTDTTASAASTDSSVSSAAASSDDADDDEQANEPGSAATDATDATDLSCRCRCLDSAASAAAEAAAAGCRPPDEQLPHKTNGSTRPAANHTRSSSSIVPGSPHNSHPLSAPTSSTFPSSMLPIPPSPALSGRSGAVESPVSLSAVASPFSARSTKSPFDWDAALRARRFPVESTKPAVKPLQPAPACATENISAKQPGSGANAPCQGGSDKSTAAAATPTAGCGAAGCVMARNARGRSASVKQIREVMTRTVTYTPRMDPAPKGKRRKVE